MITKEYIESAYNQVLAELSQIFPIEKWKHQPIGLDFTDQKASYGKATSEGMILINTAFIGTTATVKLNNTIRHEFTHLAIGLTKHHNRVFKRFESLFGVDHSLVSREELDQIEANIGFKYTLLAHLENKEVVSLGGAHRKSKKYLEYSLDNLYKGWTIEKVRIVKFEYRVN